MASQRSQPPSVLETHKKSAFPSSIPAHRSTSSLITSNQNSFARPSSSGTLAAHTGIPTFRSLRSLLPFGPNKQVTPVSTSVSPASRSSFSGFGSVRRSAQREPKPSPSILPVISIERSPGETTRGLYSRSEKPLPDEPSPAHEHPARHENDADGSATAPTLRTPSPGLPLSADLSTILEADNSGISTLIPSSGLPLSPILSPTDTTLSHSSTTIGCPDVQMGESTFKYDREPDTSTLDVSVTHVAKQVLDAIKADNSEAANEWITSDKAIIIDGDQVRESSGETPDASLNLGSLDPDLVALLSPHRRPSSNSNNTVIISHPKPSIDLSPSANFPSSSPTPKFLSSFPSPNPPHESLSSSTYKHTISRLSRQNSSLPRLRAPFGSSPSLTIINSSSSSDQDGMTTCNVSSDSLQTQTAQVQRRTTAPPSPLSTSASVSASPTESTARTARRGGPQSSTVTPSFLTSLASNRLLGNAEKRPSLRQIVSSPAPPTEWGEVDNQSRYSPSPSSALTGTMSRPSLESTSRGSIDSRTRPSLDVKSFHPSLESSHSVGDSPMPVRPSIETGKSSHDAQHNRDRSASVARMRKRSMSVQERFGQYHDCVSGDMRPSSSLSNRVNGRRGEPVSGSAGSAGGPPVTEWLGPRTAKAFKEAGLMDFDRERDGERNPSSAGNGYSGLGRFASLRSNSEYIARTHSRMALSEAGSGGGSLSNSASRRGSESFSYGLMDSPTFTVSSGSRDTPQSASTGPTSVSRSSFGFLGREREREKDREREEIRELKEKHATETGALLGALSDSQRTTRLLREENADLRGQLDRLGHVEIENDELRRTVGHLRKEVGELWAKSNNRFGTWRDSRRDRHEHDLLDSPGLSSSTPVPASKRRFSTTSSIFPVPPSNMKMLLHEDAGAASANQSRFSLTQSPNISLRPHGQNNSIVSVTNVSPTTANFSIVTGSPGSLFLKPEHEVHLGDMESLDLGVRSGGETNEDWIE